jgi:TRAP-type uncharacterized transport system substrate-binding protein
MLPSIRGQAVRDSNFTPEWRSGGPGCFRWPRNVRRVSLIVIALLLFPVMALMTMQAAVAQQARPQQSGRPVSPRPVPGHTAPSRPVLSQPQLLQMLQKKHNETVLMLLGGAPGTSYFDVAHDMAAAVSANNGPRLVVVDALGGIDSLHDLLLLRGIDLALVPRNVLDYADATGAVGPMLRERLTYIAVLYSEEIHVLAGRGVTSIEELAGRKVAVPPGDGNTDFAVRDLFRRLHIDAEIVKVAGVDAIDDVRSGALGALVLVGGKPLRFITALPKDGSLHLVPVPSHDAFGEEYSPGSFSAGDYPNLIPGEQTIDTVSVGIVLAAGKTAAADESNQRIARFVPMFFSSLSDLSGPRWHPKWTEVNLVATLDKWQRVPAAKEWLDNALREQSASVHKDFEEFLRVNGPPGVPSPAVRKQLFDEYLKWTRSTTTAPR